jgi:hypothetical protein
MQTLNSHPECGIVCANCDAPGVVFDYAGSAPTSALRLLFVLTPNALNGVNECPKQLVAATSTITITNSALFWR